MNPFIMIVGCPRSGTTMVRNMLTSHPDVFIFPQTQFFNKIWSARNLFNFKRNRHSMLKIIAKDAAVKRSGLEIFSLGRNRSYGFNNYFTEYLNLIREYNDSGKSYIGDKTPRHAMFVGLLKNKIKASLKTIVIIRDSRAVVASMKARGLVKNIEAGAAIWNFFCKHVLNLLHKFPKEEVLLIRYEDIVTDSVARSHEISNFIGIDYNSAMVNIKGNNSSFDRSEKSGIFSESLNIWKEKLSSKEINSISCLTKRNLAYFKYEIPLISPNNISKLSRGLYWSVLIREEIILFLMRMGLFPTPLLEKIKDFSNR